MESLTKMKNTMSVKEYREFVNKNYTIAPRKQTAKNYIVNVLKELKLPYKTEFRFHSKRRFRFDWAIITTHLKIGIEYEGLMSRKSRHTTIGGFSKDCEKYSLASIEGWIVLRYTALNYRNIKSDIENSFKKI